LTSNSILFTEFRFGCFICDKDKFFVDVARHDGSLIPVGWEEDSKLICRRHTLNLPDVQ
jgi:hypothetical protein